MKKIKIINDPVSGFIRVSEEIYANIIDHPYFQRLRLIKQLGMTYLVFPGATHTRFHHTLGAFNLMDLAVENLKLKEVEITKHEEMAAKIAILLHDIGHGPFSHSLEFALIEGVSHEEISLAFMHKLNEEFNGKLDLALKLFSNDYPKKFLHQLISGQLDVDRLDYLRRDSFYTGVTEGNIGSDRIIRMMNVFNNELVVEKKGIYSIENFLIARSLMYWQVYLHKTVLAAEKLLINILKRAKELAKAGENLFCSPPLQFFLYNEVNRSDFTNQKVLNNFALLDDTDILVSIKNWMNHSDQILSLLSKNLIERKLFKTELSSFPFDSGKVLGLMQQVSKKYKISIDQCKYFVETDKVENIVYENSKSGINILINESIVDIADASIMAGKNFNPEKVEQYFIFYPKNL